MSDFNDLVKQICEKNNIELEVLSFGYVLKLTKQDKVHYIIGKKFDLNLDSSSQIAKDKYATIEVLKSCRIPTIDASVLFNPKTRHQYVIDGGNLSYISSYLKQNKKIVLKPNDGLGGNNVFLCSNLMDAKCCLDRLFISNDMVLVSPYYNILKEYRVFVLDGLPKLIYSKQKPFVIGNGKDNLKTLIEKIYNDKKIIEKLFEENKEKLNDIISKDEKYYIGWKHNLCYGSFVEVLENIDCCKDISNIAKEAVFSLNLRFATVDIIELDDGTLKVLEINSSIGSNIFSSMNEKNKVLIQNLFEDAILNLFR